jgi:hypothetical protein
MTANTITAVRDRTMLRVTVLDESLYDFNGYVRHCALCSQPINGDREAFHEYLPEFAQGARFTLEAWDKWHLGFLKTLDAADLRDTQADVIASSYPF